MNTMRDVFPCECLFPCVCWMDDIRWRAKNFDRGEQKVGVDIGPVADAFWRGGVRSSERVVGEQGRKVYMLDYGMDTDML